MPTLAWFIIGILIGANVGFFFGRAVAGSFCILLAFLAFAPTMAKAECLDSASAVRQAHNGAHATWHNVDGHRCYMAGYGHSRRLEAKVIPLPRERPATIKVRSASTDAPESQGKQGISDVSRDEARQHLTGTSELLYAEGKRLLALAMNDWIEKRKAKLAEVGR